MAVASEIGVLVSVREWAVKMSGSGEISGWIFSIISVLVGELTTVE